MARKKKIRIRLMQANPVVGDFAGNAEKVRLAAESAVAARVDLVVTPELFLCGYPPRDLLDESGFVERQIEAARVLARRLPANLPVLLGMVWPNPAKTGKPWVNAAVVLQGGSASLVAAKRLLPEYDVFDESRHFAPGAAKKAPVFKVAGLRIGVGICEDLWDETGSKGRRWYGESPVEALAGRCDVAVNLSASPFEFGKQASRLAVLRSAAKRIGAPVLYVNATGGQDELLFDGRSLAVNPHGETLLFAPAFTEADLDVDPFGPPAGLPEEDEDELAAQALVTGIRDYFRKAGGFRRAVLGLSGGIDSALVAALACEALGAENVLGVMMPSPYSSTGSLVDSRALASRLGMRTEEIGIEPVMAAFDRVLTGPFRGGPEGLAKENLQSRIRGNLLMAFSNRDGSLVLNTGNKSEMATGYCTIYGDMNGALSPLGDLLKTRVYRVCRHLNRRAGREIIPEEILVKAPSAELRPGQKDSDSLPDYDLLDAILVEILERGSSLDTLEAKGFDPALLRDVAKKIRVNEHKRRQAPPVLKLTSKAFGTGRRIPLSRDAFPAKP